MDSTPTMKRVLVVLTNMPDVPSAQAMARQLVEKKLAACVSIQCGVESFYRWQGMIEQATEVSVLIKTTQDMYTEVEAAIKLGHSLFQWHMRLKRPYFQRHMRLK